MINVRALSLRFAPLARKGGAKRRLNSSDHDYRTPLGAMTELDIHIFRFLYHALSGGWLWPMVVLSAIGGGWGAVTVLPLLASPRTRRFAESLAAVLGVTAVLVFRKLTKGRQSWTNFGVRTYYEPQVVGRQIKLVRQGSFEIVSHKYGKKPQFMLRSIVARMMNETKELDLVPAKLAADERIADLAVTQLDIVDGWIAVAFGPQTNGRYVANREPAAEAKK